MQFIHIPSARNQGSSSTQFSVANDGHWLTHCILYLAAVQEKTNGELTELKLLIKSPNQVAPKALAKSLWLGSICSL